MSVIHQTQEVDSPLHKPMFHDVTAAAALAVKDSGIRMGLIVVYSPHTTCSVIIQEESHDRLYDGTEHLLQDLLDRLELMIPTCRHEGQYLHPGKLHIAHAVDNLGEQAAWSLNTDAHLRSALVGRSESIPIVDGQVQLGQFGRIYFVDFDGTRARTRTVHFQMVGE